MGVGLTSLIMAVEVPSNNPQSQNAISTMICASSIILLIIMPTVLFSFLPLILFEVQLLS